MKRLTPRDTSILNDYTACLIQMFISVTILESESPSSKASVLCRRTYDRVTADLVEKGNERDAEKKKISKTYKIFIITSLRFSYNLVSSYSPHLSPTLPKSTHPSTFTYVYCIFFLFKPFQITLYCLNLPGCMIIQEHLHIWTTSSSDSKHKIWAGSSQSCEMAFRRVSGVISLTISACGTNMNAWV